MSDRELLEYAAKAACIELNGWSVYAKAFWLGGEQINQLVPWNPITDDGDALRLAVKLWILHRYKMDTVVAMVDFDATDTDIYASTRRAIVRAAAEIGKAMK